MKPPIITNESRRIDVPGDVSFWRSIEVVEGWAEPIDVENAEYSVFDSEGRLLEFETDRKRVWLIEAESEPTHQLILRKIIQDLFRSHYADATWVKTASLEELVNEGVKKFCYY